MRGGVVENISETRKKSIYWAAAVIAVGLVAASIAILVGN
jgi:hypothetical protein